MRSHYLWIVAIVGALLVALSIYIASLGDLTRQIPRFLLLFALMFVLYLFSVFVFSRLRQAYRSTLAVIFVVAIACRVVYMGSTPTLSNDIYRYLWEGRVIQTGFNPFQYPPDATELRFLRDADYEHINHKHLETIYPPLAQGAFYIGAAAHPDVKTQRVIFVLFDLATLVLIVLLLRARRSNLNLCAVYAWSPLVILEFSHSGHMDSLGIFFLILGLLLIQERKTWLGIASLAFSFLAKYLSVLLLPYFVFRKRHVPWLLLFVLIVVLGYVPFTDAPRGLISSLTVYGEHWEFNSPIYVLAKKGFGPSNLIRIALLAVVVLLAFYQGYRVDDLTRYSYRVIGVALILSPTIYPWYLCWIVPFLCFHTSRAWLVLTGAVVLSYWVWVTFRDTGAWEVGTELLLAQYVPFFTILAYDSYRTVRPRHGIAN